jgi:lipopolysaccharide transport system ATP-binding protein
MALCPRAIQIRAGAIAADGPSAEVVSSYLHEEHAPGASKEWRDVTTAPGDRVVRLLGVRTKSSDGLAASVVDIHKPVGIELEFEVIEGGHVLTPLVQCFNQDGTCVFTSAEVDSPWRRVERTPGRYVAVAWVPGNLLAEGTVIVGAGISSLNPPVMHVHERDTVSFEIIDSFTGDGSRGDYGGPLPGVVRPTLRWETRSAPDAQSDILPAFSQAAKIRR